MMSWSKTFKLDGSDDEEIKAFVEKNITGQIPMTFPDEKMIRAAAREIAALDGDNLTLLESDPETYANDLKSYDDYAGSILAAALTDYRTRTGIDVGDVVAKLSDGTHTLAPIEPDAAMLQTAHDVLKAIYSDDHVRSEMSFMWMKVHRAVARANLIRAAQEKVE